MGLVLCLVLICLSVISVSGVGAASPYGKEVDRLLDIKGLTAREFGERVAQAGRDGLVRQGQLEALLLFPIRTGDFSGVGEALAEAEQSVATWNYSDSPLFSSREELQGLLAALRGRLARDAGDMDSFRQEVQKAFWLNPELGRIMANWIEEYRSQEIMKTIRLPMNLELATSQGEKVTLAKLVSGRKAVLLDFWASWCGPCMRLMPELAHKAKVLESQNILVAGINTENSPEKAEKVRADKNIAFTWLVEPESEPFSKPLRIDSIPRMILVSPEGAVLYNGHPGDPQLAQALAKLGAKLE